MKRKPRTTARPFRPDALTWIDFLVIGAIALTFIAIASTTISHAKASDYNESVEWQPTQVANARRHASSK